MKTEINVYKDYFNPDMSEAYKDKFIKVPCEYFQYLYFDDKLLLTLLSLFKHKTIYNTITITLKDIIKFKKELENPKKIKKEEE